MSSRNSCSVGVLVRLSAEVPPKLNRKMSKLLPLVPVFISVQTTFVPEIAGEFCWSVALPVESWVIVPGTPAYADIVTLSRSIETIRLSIICLENRLMLCMCLPLKTLLKAARRHGVKGFLQPVRVTMNLVCEERNYIRNCFCRKDVILTNGGLSQYQLCCSV